MNDKKNIDRLFQEKFKDFEVAPNEQVWPNIESALHPKKKRRIIPFWWQLGGVAAGLIIGFFALNSLLKNDVAVDENPVVIEDVGKPAVSPLENDSNSPETDSDASDALEKAAVPKANGNEQLVNSGTSGNSSGKSEDDLKKRTNTVSSTKNRAIVTAPETTRKTNNPVEKNQMEKNRLNPENPLVGQQTQEKEKSAANPTAMGANTPKNVNQGIAVEDRKNTDDNNIGNPNRLGNPKDPASNVMANKPDSNQEKIASNMIPPDEITDDKKDSTAVATVEEPNALEELLKKNEKEEKTVAEAKVNRWQVTPNVAPIYFSSTSNGSPIDAQFASNSKSFENNLSYGVGINYALTSKISLRTGINTFTLGYDTNDVVMFAALDQPTFSNVASSAAGSTIQVISRINASAMSPFDSSIQNTSNATMTQRMGYLEVPLEMSYKLVDKKFGVNVIGGLSTLFLNQNELSVASASMSASLGRAKNLNDIHFSTNVGLGFKYRFWKAFEANFEPMFKYQINTFNKDAGNFKPYFIGLYSGVSFNF